MPLWLPGEGIEQMNDQKMPSKNGAAGITLIEILVVISIIGLLAFLAAPELSSSIKRSRVQACAKGLASDITVARANAQSSGQRAVVVISKDNMYDFNGNGTMEHFFAFVDANLNNAYDAGDTVVTQDACYFMVNMEPSGSPLNDCTNFANAQCIKFTALGTLFPDTTNPTTDRIVQMYYNDGTNAYKARVTVISMTGLVKTQVSADGGSTWKDF